MCILECPEMSMTASSIYASGCGGYVVIYALFAGYLISAKWPSAWRSLHRGPNSGCWLAVVRAAG